MARSTSGSRLPGAILLALGLSLPMSAAARPVETEVPPTDLAPPTELSAWERVNFFRIHPDSLACGLTWAEDPYPIAADTAESRVFAKAILETWAGPLEDGDLDRFEAGLSVMFAQEGVEPPSAAVVALTFSTAEHAANFLGRVRAALAGEQGFELHQSGRTLVFFYGAPSLDEGCAGGIRSQLRRALPGSR